MKIRNARKDDIQGIYEVFLDLVEAEDKASAKVSASMRRIRKRRPDFERSSKKDLLSDVKDRKKRFIVAVEGKQVLGYGLGSMVPTKSPFFIYPKMGYINAIVVKKPRRGQKIAARLHDELISWFKKRGCTSVWLEVFNPNPALKMYEKWGYNRALQYMHKKIK